MKKGDLIVHYDGRRGRFVSSNDGFILVERIATRVYFDCWNPEDCRLDWRADLEHFLVKVEQKILSVFVDGVLDRFLLRMSVTIALFFLGVAIGLMF